MILQGFIPICRWLSVSILIFFVLIHSGKCQDKTDFQDFDLQIFRSGTPYPIVQKRAISELAMKNAIQTELELFFNNGFPFAKALFDTLKGTNRTQVFVKIDPGPEIVNGPIVLESDTSFNPNMLARFLRFRVGQNFSLEKFNRIPVFVSQLQMAKSTRLPRLEWFGEKAVLHLYLEKRKNNSLSGILGILPQFGNSKPIVTGNIDASLQNLFGWGLALDLKWNRFAPSSQIAQVKILHEALGFNGLGLEAFADLFRQDSLLNRQRFELRLITSPKGVWKYKLGIQSLSASSNFGFGSSNFQKINSQSLTFSAAYDLVPQEEINLKSTYFSSVLRPTLKSFFSNQNESKIPQLDAQVQFSWPFPISSNRFAIQTSGQFAGVWSETILVPDQFQVGGIMNLRGFNENAFFSTQHALLTFQPRYLIDKNTLFNVFGQAMALNSTLFSKEVDNLKWLFSAGFGLELDLGFNRINLSLANGFSKDVPFDIQTSKIHFGYVARF